MRISIIGAGISGLSSAFYLDKLAKKLGTEIDIDIFEKTSKPGGTISTVKEDGFTIEEGADSFFTSRPWALELCREIGLEDKLISPNKKNRRTFVYFDSKLNVLPEGFFLMAPSNLEAFSLSNFFSESEKERILNEKYLPTKENSGDESVDEFVKRRFGSELLEKVAKPLIGGIYTGDTEKLSVNAVLPEFVSMEKQFGSVIKGIQSKYASPEVSGAESGARYGLFLSLEGGLSTLIDRLVDVLPNVNFSYDCELKSLSKGDGKWILKDVTGNEYSSDGVILAVPSYISSELLAGVDKELSARLSRIKSASSVIAIFTINKEEAVKLPDGFGIVVPPSEGLNILACSFSTRKFPGRSREGYEIVRCFAGGALNPDILDKSESEISDLLLSELNLILNADFKPESTKVKKYFDAMPQYNIGYLDLIKEIDKKIADLKTVSIAGNAYGGVGIPDCIKSGLKAAEYIFESFNSNLN